ncbi:MAG: chalcone isomerase family protein [Rhodocyclaceae bacterium]|nr:chalcone isomerase family protein [Rhodocyclaceae bacterium]
MAAPHRFRTFVLACLLGIAQAATATEVAGVRFDDTVEVQSATLRLNGAGLRTRFFFKVYAIGLYLSAEAATPAAALAATGAKRVRIVTLREVSAEKFADALMNGVRANQTPEAYARIEPRVLDLRARMLARGSAKEGTEVILDLLPTAGTVLQVDGDRLGEPIPGADFQHALLSVWLGGAPVDEGLRKALAPARP